MKIILDNIIFALQNSGGISILWGEVIKAFQEDDVQYLDYENETNIVRRHLLIRNDKIIKNNYKKPIFLRYLNPKLSNYKSKFIFISSYYRTCSNKNAINVSIVHDFTYEYFSNGYKKHVHSLQKKKAIENSELIICISENTKKDMIKFSPNVDPKKIHVIYNGVSNDYKKEYISNGFSEVDKNLKYLDNKKVLLFVGGRKGYKNFDKIVETISIMDDKYHLLIVGEPFSEDEIRFLKSKLRINMYTLLERIDNKKLNKIYNLSHLLLYCSAYEGFGIPIIEAMKTGLPVIAYNASSIPEIVGNAGVLLDDLSPDNIKKSIMFFENDGFRSEYSRLGVIRASDFSWEKTMLQYKQVLRDSFVENM